MSGVILVVIISILGTINMSATAGSIIPMSIGIMIINNIVIHTIVNIIAIITNLIIIATAIVVIQRIMMCTNRTITIIAIVTNVV